ncbi:MAG: DUF3050 domain-containing protein [Planctomycetota bacterium]|nr:DUF3050 domain-containing protein [Planctomycetota bacterium]
MELGLEPYYARLRSHPIYEMVSHSEGVCRFMETHVFAVWDFQALLKSLQRVLTCVEVPWVPTQDPISRRLINEIVLEEESDEDMHGGYASHYELYLNAMEECGASTHCIRRFVQRVRSGKPVRQALIGADAPEGIEPFVSTTMDIAQGGRAHQIAAAFSYGREEAVPLMFVELVEHLHKQRQDSWATFLYYLERHIGLDSEEHGPQAKNILKRLCGSNPTLWEESFEAARKSLQARITLWDQFVASYSGCPV